MPSAYILKQAKLLHDTKDCFGVLQNLRDQYALSSFPSQMTRVKEAWYEFGERHEVFENMRKEGIKYLVREGVGRRYISQFEIFCNDDMKEQIRKTHCASKGALTGSRRTDAVISNMKILPDYMKDYKLTSTDLVANSALATKCLEKRATNCVVVSDGDALVGKCRKILAELTEDDFIVAAALAVVCGRRSIELLKVGHFRQNRDRGEYSCYFKGSAKKRGLDDTQFDDIPLLVKYKYFTRALNHLRNRVIVGDMTNSQINAKFSHKLGDAAKILTDSLCTRFHDLRAIYGCLTHKLFDNSCSINIWLKSVLMHDNIDTSVFYSRCKIDKCSQNFGKWDVVL